MPTEQNNLETNKITLSSIISGLFTLPIGAVSLFTVFNQPLITRILTNTLNSPSLASILSFIIYAIGLLIIGFYATIILGSLGLFFLGLFTNDLSLMSVSLIVICLSAVVTILSTLLPFHPVVAFYITSNLIFYGSTLLSLSLSFVLNVLVE